MPYPQHARAPRPPLNLCCRGLAFGYGTGCEDDGGGAEAGEFEGGFEAETAVCAGDEDGVGGEGGDGVDGGVEFGVDELINEGYEGGHGGWNGRFAGREE